MDDQPYATPAALDQALTDRIKRRYPSVEFHYRRNEVAYRRLVARLFATAPDAWVLKGGYAMILRLDPNRTSNDLDVAFVQAAGKHGLALSEFERAMGNDLGDFFSFEVLRVGEVRAERARPITVRCLLGAREFTTFRVDVAVPTSGVLTEGLATLPTLVGIDQIDQSPPIRVVAWTQQSPTRRARCSRFIQWAIRRALETWRTSA